MFNQDPGNKPILSALLCAPLFLLGMASAQTRPLPVAETPGANLPAQPIGANDLISISVYDAPELSRTARVGADGFVRLPMLRKPIKAEGAMPSDLETTIAAALREDQLIVDPFVTVNVAEYNSRPISVAGAVKTPLTFQAIGPLTLLEAITRAGGLSPEAGAEILVSRSQPGAEGAQIKLVQRIPVKGLIDAADPKLNIPLTGGEEIRVPEVGKVFIVGNVTKPGAYPILDATDSSVLKMLAVAEGLQRYATKEAYIYRREGNGDKNEIPVPLSKIMERKAPDMPLLANDILYVPDNKTRRMTLGALEKLVMIGGGVGAALVYAGVK
ncbi:MAG: polysaccharide biosynthesis/export family protein [Bryobacteraceae bacterium]|jgi:polysaccharide export outer membrane protein